MGGGLQADLDGVEAGRSALDLCRSANVRMADWLRSVNRFKENGVDSPASLDMPEKTPPTKPLYLLFWPPAAAAGSASDMEARRVTHGIAAGGSAGDAFMMAGDIQDSFLVFSREPAGAGVGARLPIGSE